VNVDWSYFSDRTSRLWLFTHDGDGCRVCIGLSVTTVCLSACPCCKTKTFSAINNKVDRDVVYGRPSARIINVEVKRSWDRLAVKKTDEVVIASVLVACIKPVLVC